MTHPRPNPENEAIHQVVEAFGRVEIPPMPDVEQTVAELVSARADPSPEDKVLFHPRSWRFPMRKFLPLAAAAALVMAVGTFFLFLPGFDSNAAFAQAVQQFRTAQTMMFTMSMAAPGQDQQLEMRATVKNPGWMVVEFEVNDQPLTQVFDFQSQQMVMLIPDQKMAQRINMEGMPRGENPNDLIAEFGRLDPEQATYLHDEVKDGVKTHVYEIDAGPIAGMTWIATDTKRPVRTEMSMSFNPDQPETGIVMKDFAWDVAVDDKRFTLAIPDDYQINEIDMSHAQPEDLAHLLQVYAALSEAPFPEQFGIETVSGIQGIMMDPDLTPQENHARLIDRLGPIYGEAALAEEHIQDTMMEMSATLGRGAIFMGTLAETAEDWQWVGGGVSAGAGDRPLCWWKPKDGETYRVIFNDFTIKQVTYDDLPELPGI